MLGSDCARYLATVKMHSPEGFGLFVRHLQTGSSASGETHLPIAWAQSHLICGAAWIATLALRVELITRRILVSPAKWRHLCELKRLMGRFVCCPHYRAR